MHVQGCMSAIELLLVLLQASVKALEQLFEQLKQRTSQEMAVLPKVGSWDCMHVTCMRFTHTSDLQAGKAHPGVTPHTSLVQHSAALQHVPDTKEAVDTCRPKHCFTRRSCSRTICSTSAATFQHTCQASAPQWLQAAQTRPRHQF